MINGMTILGDYQFRHRNLRKVEKKYNAVNKKIGTSCPELSTKQLDQLTMVSNMVVPWVDPQLDITIPKPKLELYISPVAPSHLHPPNKSSQFEFLLQLR